MNEAKRWKVLFFSALCTMDVCVRACVRTCEWISFWLCSFSVIRLGVRNYESTATIHTNQHMHRCCVHLPFNRCSYVPLRLSLAFLSFGFLSSMCICIKCDCFIAFFRSFKKRVIPKKTAPCILYEPAYTQHIYLFI